MPPKTKLLPLNEEIGKWRDIPPHPSEVTAYCAWRRLVGLRLKTLSLSQHLDHDVVSIEFTKGVKLELTLVPGSVFSVQLSKPYKNKE